MNDFQNALTFITKQVYQPNGLTVSNTLEEKQNAKYGAGTFLLSSKSVRFRVAHKTPTKLGQFVAFWEKDEHNQNQPFSAEASPDLLVITTFKNETGFGQFVFPKALLLKQHILRSETTKGKMAMRVYPVWDKPTSKQALKTQAWQMPYFIDLSGVVERNELRNSYQFS
ncbi:hypothetical protein JCM19046_1729 [Bacillus sp. JCM 19046]|nr:hypothetical protein JCM19045_307 [Bacillus sp. JCM 19045]GAF17227.1 hypothetical protein JCM19046_1729 [Bacillus sp. JCM 19046]